MGATKKVPDSKNNARLCPKCHSDTLIVDTRDKYNTTWRRHKCKSCGKIYQTLEFYLDDYSQFAHRERLMGMMFDSIQGVTDKYTKVLHNDDSK